MKDPHEELEKLTDKEEQEIFNKVREKFGHDLTRLVSFFHSMDYGIIEIKIIVSLLLSVMLKTEKLDEEDIRDIFHGIKHIKDRIVFK